MCPLQGLKMFPSPACRLMYRSPLSAVSTTCKEITWDKCYLLSMEVRVLRCSLQAWLRNVYSLKLCTRKWQCLHKWDKCHKIDMNSSKSNSYFWSLLGPAPEGTPSMHSSWWEYRGACAGCRSVESHLFMEGGFVCKWQVASCSEGSPSAKHVRTHGRVDWVDTLQDLLKRLMGLRSTNCWRFLFVISGESHPYHVQEW